ncbi:MAG: 3-methylcrotonyl-CoA carboxylase, partial [bacterium]|nr:3-methylcrotonyl-CoA carboxylase [bacterium]
NRGEIACRVIESAQKMGYETIALFSEIDKGARHVMLADRAVCAGPAPAAESYLNIERVISAAKRSGARSIHPGYGFLSENADFANACEEAGIVFIGPPVHAIKIMGNKAASKKEMLSAGVPCIPGYQGSEQSDQALIEASQEVGYPLMVKAAAGGGGRGMRFVHDPQHLAESIQS